MGQDYRIMAEWRRIERLENPHDPYAFLEKVERPYPNRDPPFDARQGRGRRGALASYSLPSVPWTERESTGVSSARTQLPGSKNLEDGSRSDPAPRRLR